MKEVSDNGTYADVNVLLETRRKDFVTEMRE
jgi:hypothetical protein